MKNNTSYKNFTRRFRQECLLDFPAGAHQYHEFYFRQYAGGRQEIDRLGKICTENMSDRPLIRRLIAKMEQDRKDNYRRLHQLLDNLDRVLPACQPVGPSLARYYQALMDVLYLFRQLIGTYQDTVQPAVITRFNSLAAGTAHAVDCFESEEVHAIIIMLEQYTDGLQQYYDELDACWCRATQLHGREAPPYQVEQGLMSILTLLEKTLITMENVQAALEIWNRRIVLRESQQISN